MSLPKSAVLRDPAGKRPVDGTDDQNEDVTKFVARCYRLCLGREADADGLNAWCSQLLSGANTAKEAAYGFVFPMNL